MIDVPTEVKKALKDGMRKKNYIMQVVNYDYDCPEDLDDWDAISTFYTENAWIGGGWTNYVYIMFPCRVKFSGPQGVTVWYRVYSDHSHIIKYGTFDGESDDFVIEGGYKLEFETTYYGQPITVNYINKKTYVPEDSFDNNNLVEESVKIDERLCSSKDLRYGLCEGSSIEFKYFGKNPIKDKIIKASIEVYYDGDSSYVIPMGYYYVSQCIRKVSNGIYNVLAYDRLGISEMQEKLNLSEWPGDPSDPTKVSMWTIIMTTLIEMGHEEVTYWPSYIINQVISTSDTTFTGVTYAYEGRTYTVHAIGKYLEWTYEGSSSNFRGYIIENITEYMALLRICLNEIKYWMDDRNINLFDSFVENSKFDEMCGITVTSTNGTKTSYTLADFEKDNGPLRDPFVFTNVKKIKACIPLTVTGKTGSYSDELVDLELEDIYANLEGEINNGFLLEIRESENNFYPTEIFKILASKDAEMSIREILSGFFEEEVAFGFIDKNTNKLLSKQLPTGLPLYPNESLYPYNFLYPRGESNIMNPVIYSQLWVDGENSVNILRDIYVYYKAIQNNSEVTLVIKAIVNEEGNYDYICSDNYFLNNYILPIEFVRDRMLAQLSRRAASQWLSYEAWCPGLPYLETGDAIEITIDGESNQGYILQRQLQGIQNLQDTFISGDVDLY